MNLINGVQRRVHNSCVVIPARTLPCSRNLIKKHLMGKGEKMGTTHTTKGDIAFLFLLLAVVIIVNGLRDFLASDSITFDMIKSYISFAAQYPEQFGDMLTSADKIWADIGAYCQVSAWVLGIVCFLMGIIVMHRVNKMGTKEGLKHVLKYVLFVAVIILVVEFIFRFLLK